MSDATIVPASERRLRIGFIGCGSHATMCIYPCLRTGASTIFNRIAMPVELVAVADLDEAKARRTARDFGAERWYTDHRAMLASEHLDAVIIVVGAAQHHRLCLDALEAGLPVLVEKPPGRDSIQTAALVTASRKAGKPIMTAFMKRFASAYRMARNASRRPEFGPLRYVDCRMTAWGPMGADDRGFAIDYYIHLADLAMSYGGDVAELTAYPIPTDGGFTGYAVAMRFASGAVGTCQFTTLQGFGTPSERVEISGHNHHCLIDNVMDFRYWRDPPAPWSRDHAHIESALDALAWQPNWTMPRDDNSSLFHLGYIGEVSHFATSILAGTEPEVTVLDAHKAMVFIEAMRASNGRPMALDFSIPHDRQDAETALAGR